MNLKIRRLIFYALIIIFLILAFFIIPYSNGWRFDPGTLSFVKLGGLYLNVEPAEASVQVSPLTSVLGAGVNKLNFEIKSSFMKSGLLIANLFPKTYHISVQKTGYQSWNKNTTIKPSLVTQIYPIILIPEKSNKKLLEIKVNNFFPSTNYLAWQDTSNRLKIGGKIIKGTKFLTWLAGEKSALVYDETTKNYLVINPAQNNSALNINLLFDNLKYQKNIDPRTYELGEGVDDKNTIKNVIGHPLDKNKLVLATDKNLYILDFYKPSLEIINPDQYNLFTASGEEIFFTDSNSLYSYNLNKNENLVLSKQKNIDLLEASPNNQFVAFSSDNKLMLLDRTKSENGLTNLVENPTYFKFSPDNKKIAAVYDNNKIKIFFIGDDYELFNKKIMGSSFFDTGSLSSDSPIAWHSNSSYIFVKSGTDLKFLEINDDSPVNLQIIDTDVDKYFYNRQENTIYLIKNESLYKIIE
ncbi:MAG: hypothetical protein AAB621_03055 [Patescibacteria group bacterium]